MADPRAANFRRFATANGLVTGVELQHIPVPGAPYELLTAELIDEQSAQGQIVARVLVMDRNNVPAQMARVHMRDLGAAPGADEDFADWTTVEIASTVVRPAAEEVA